MTAVLFYFQVHQPDRLLPFRPADVGAGRPWFDDQVNREILERVAERCYLAMNEILLEQIEATEGRFQCAFSISGTAIAQMRRWAPKALDSFVALAETGCVEFLAETSHHSLAFDRRAEAPTGDEFEAQVQAHAAVIEDLFGKRPTTFRNTELCIDEELALRVERLGYKVLLGEGADRLLGWRSAQYPYRPRGCEELTLLLRSYDFSDDIAFRFSNPDWPHRPLFADTFAGWLHAVPEHAQFLGLFMDYETFGEHQWAETGILEFMRHLPRFVLEDERFSFSTPAAFAAEHPPVADLEIPSVVSWADQERDLTAWLGNPMQQEAHRSLYALREKVLAAGDPELSAAWRKLTTSDHVYYMCTKYFSDGDVHKYFTPYDSPHESFVRFISVLGDLEARLDAKLAAPLPAQAPKATSKRPAAKKPVKRPRRPEQA